MVLLKFVDPSSVTFSTQMSYDAYMSNNGKTAVIIIGQGHAPYPVIEMHSKLQIKTFHKYGKK